MASNSDRQQQQLKREQRDDNPTASSVTTNSGPQRRRKISLACEPCRKRKSQCDGAKPICSMCYRRSLPINRCIYTVENSRTASSEAYIKALHNRIRVLEQTCAEHDIKPPPFDTPAASDSELSTLDTSAGAQNETHALDAAMGDRTPPTDDSITVYGASQQFPSRQASPAPRSPSVARQSPSPRHHHHHQSATPGPSHSMQPPPPPPPPPPPTAAPVSPLQDLGMSSDRHDAPDPPGSVTAMGTVSADQDVGQDFDVNDEFYGSSSAASFMKETYRSVKPVDHNPGPSPAAFTRAETSRSHVHFAQPGKFTLPPRDLADHLLDRYWERVYWMYPFFHKPTFMQAYESLWRPSHASQEQSEPAMPGLGLGSGPGAGPNTIVFHCSLNVIFSIACQFSDLSPEDKGPAIQTFFERGKSFVGLDLIDMHNVGVVQSLLLMTMFMQSTPFPSRCWNSVGLACRVAQGLGLHAEPGRGNMSPLEREVRRRTWHGCVILDMIVSMTYGRPAMTAHLPGLPLPQTVELESWDSISEAITTLTNSDVPSKMYFYIEKIQQCRIGHDILIRIYQTSGGGEATTARWDAFLDIDDRLSRYEMAVDPIMSWKSPCSLEALDPDRRLVIVAQRVVLQESFLYFRLMLHRPILTQLCASESGGGSSITTRAHSPPDGGALYTLVAKGCSKICLETAMELIDLVHDTYQTNKTGGWWWDVLYAFTAGLAIILGHSCPSLLAELDKHRLERCWMLCQEILKSIATFSVSAERSLKYLQKIHEDVMSRVLENGDDSSMRTPYGVPSAIHTGGEQLHGAGAGPSQGGHMQPPYSHMPMNTTNYYQPWLVPSGADYDIMGAGAVFNWDYSLDLMAGGFGVESFQGP